MCSWSVWSIVLGSSHTHTDEETESLWPKKLYKITWHLSTRSQTLSVRVTVSSSCSVRLRSPPSLPIRMDTRGTETPVPPAADVRAVLLGLSCGRRGMERSWSRSLIRIHSPFSPWVCVDVWRSDHVCQGKRGPDQRQCQPAALLLFCRGECRCVIPSKKKWS